MKIRRDTTFANMTRLAAARLCLCLFVVAIFAASGAPMRSKGVPSGWMEDFNKAMAAAASANKYILMCSVDSGSSYGQNLYRNVYSQGKFSGKLKNRFILLMIDTTGNARNLSLVALAQNSKLRHRYGLSSNGDCCIIDKYGEKLRMFQLFGDANSSWMKVEAVANSISPPSDPAVGTASSMKTDDGSVVSTARSSASAAVDKPSFMSPSAHLREANRLASIGKWGGALEHFKSSGGKFAKMASLEIGNNADLFELADAWRKAMPDAPDDATRRAYRAHAKHLYRRVAAEGNLSSELRETAARRGVEKDDALYCIIDLSGGLTATSYQVSYLDGVPEGGWSDEHKTTQLVLRRIPAGSFIMGKNQNDEFHRINFKKPFYMGVFEVTQRQYELVTGGNPSKHRGDMRPVGFLSWEDIRGSSYKYDWPNVRTTDPNSFVGRLKVRTGLAFDLPTEAQWEYACRAGTKSKYYDGSNEPNNLPQLARYAFNQKDRGYKEPNSLFRQHKPDGKGGYVSHCTVVGMYLPNAWGLYDMYGNVWEWCVSRGYNGTWRGDGLDPEGWKSGQERIRRGGCWDNFPYDESSLHSSAWDLEKADRRYPTFGFRVIFTPGAEPPPAVVSQPVVSQPAPQPPPLEPVPEPVPQPVVQQPAPQPPPQVEKVSPPVSTPSVRGASKREYCVIDLSKGPSATSYSVSYLDSAPNNGWSDDCKTTKLVLRCIPAGSFIMGRNQSDVSRTVKFDKPFYMGVFEVTQKQWALVMGADPASMKGERRPVEKIRFLDAFGNPGDDEPSPDSFVGKLKARTGIAFSLPTEAQWEYACRAGTKSAFNNGCNVEYEEMWQLGRFYFNQETELEFRITRDPSYHQRPDGRGGFTRGHTEVGSYLPNDWGLYDMHGNVAEMCRTESGFAYRGGSWADSAHRQGVSRHKSYISLKPNGDDPQDWLGIRLMAQQ